MMVVEVGGVALVKGQQNPRWVEITGTNLVHSVWKDKSSAFAEEGRVGQAFGGYQLVKLWQLIAMFQVGAFVGTEEKRGYHSMMQMMRGP